jgi:hypothetical protein
VMEWRNSSRLAKTGTALKGISTWPTEAGGEPLGRMLVLMMYANLLGSLFTYNSDFSSRSVDGF